MLISRRQVEQCSVVSLTTVVENFAMKLGRLASTFRSQWVRKRPPITSLKLPPAVTVPALLLTTVFVGCLGSPTLAGTLLGMMPVGVDLRYQNGQLNY